MHMYRQFIYFWKTNETGNMKENKENSSNVKCGDYADNLDEKVMIYCIC